MQQDTLQKLLEVVTDQEKAELTTLHNAVVSTIRSYREDPTAANKRDWDAAKKGLQEIMDRLWDKYFPADTEKQQNINLKNPRQVYQYLKDRYHVGQKTIYRHVEAGKLKPKRGGGFSSRTVEAYAKSHLTPRAGAGQVDFQDDEDPAENSGAQERRQLADAELKEEQARRARMLRMKEEARLVETETVEQELVTRHRIFSYSLDNFFQERMDDVAAIFGGDEQRAREIIELVDGDPEKAWDLLQWMQARVPDLISYFLERKEEWLNAYATGAWYTDELARVMEKWKQQDQ